MISPFTAVWLYGSAARGDSDSESDVDILVVGDHCLEKNELTAISNADSRKLSISHYTWHELKGIASYGSLFLHHLRREARCLVEGSAVIGEMRSILDSLGPYRRARMDLNAFETSVADVQYSLTHDGSIPFELSILATTLRHASILGCYVSGQPCFARLEPIRQFVEEWHLDAATITCFEELYRYRLWAVRHSGVPSEVSMQQVDRWCELISDLLGELGIQIDVYERSVHQAH